MNLRLLGLPALLQRDGRWFELTAKDAALLALLAIEGATSRGRLASLLWPDKPPAQRLANLRQRLMRLEDRSFGPLFEREGLAVRLAPGVQHDYPGAADDLTTAPGSPANRLLAGQHLDDSAELAAWVDRVRLSLRARQRAAWAAAAESLEQGQRVADALVYAQRLVEDDPLQEHAHRRVMRLHYQRGDRGAALAQYARLEACLRQELDSAPSSETRELAELVARAVAKGADEVPRPNAEQLALLRRPVELLQRDRQWQQLRRAWDSGRSVLLLGAAGMGKSRLLEDFADSMQVTLRVRARPGDAAVPYALLGRLVQARLSGAGQLSEEARGELARLEPALGPVPPGPMIPLRLARAVAALLAGVKAVVIDDLHHADLASLDLLPACLESPMLALLAVRPEAMQPTVAGWTGDEGWLDAITLTPLAQGAVERLLGMLELSEVAVGPHGHRAAMAQALLRHTGGNPYFLLETLRAMTRAESGDPWAGRLPVTESIQQMIEHRIARLSPLARSLAWVSGLAGGDFDAAMAADVLDLTPTQVVDPWLELRSAQLVNDQGFVHDLVTEAIRASLPGPVAAPLHGRIAAYLERVGAPSARQAEHWGAAGMWTRAAGSHEAAARAAAAASRSTEAQAHWAAAAEAHERVGETEAAFDATVERAQSLVLSGVIDQGQELAGRLLRSAQGPQQLAKAARIAAHAHMQASEWQAGHDAALQSIQTARQAGLLDVEIDATLLAATSAAQTGALAQSLDYLARAEHMVAGRGADKTLLGLLEMKAYVLDRVGRCAESVALCNQAVDLAAALGELTELMTLYSNRSSLQGKLAKLPQALADARQAATVGDRIGQMQGYQGCIVTLHRGLYGALCGQFDGVVEDIETALAGLERLGLAWGRAIVENQLAWVWIMLGQVARAQQILHVPIEPMPRPTAARRLGLQARLVRFCGGASPVFPPDWQDGSIEPSVALSVRIDQARAASPEAALEGCQAVARDAHAMSLTSAWFNARVGVVEALRSLDPQQAARQALQLERDLHDHQPADAWWPEVLHMLQQALREAGDVAAADRLVTRAVHWLQAAHATLPAPFRSSFMERNRVNAELLRLHRTGLSGRGMG